MDTTTQSNYLQITTEHIHFDWSLDFSSSVIGGTATHHLLVKKDDVTEVIFDTQELDISSVMINGKLVDFELGRNHEVMGSALQVTLPTGLKSGQRINVTVMYKTTTRSNALQWLDKEQTQGKAFPYLFSQCQPIYARSIAPLQDTPSVKIRYSASVASVLPVLLSAIRVAPPSNGPAHDGKVIGKDLVTYLYDQPIAIPPYILAIAAGNIRYRAFPQYEDRQWKSGIWAEPELIDDAYWEFSEDTTRFLAAEEKLVTPYEFGVYDLLVLPPSFPYGGMENSCLSFLTPTLLTGDRSLVDVVVHELTHSWFGNGITQANSSHFWLNEGWTTYIERVMQEILKTPAHRGFSFIIGSKALYDALEQYNDEGRRKYQRLVIDFAIGDNPDDAYSSIPYEKGANFLLHIERTLGGLEVFLPYVKDYVRTFLGKSITTQEWKDHLYAYWEKHGGQKKIDALNDINWDAWLFGEGLELPVKMEYDTTLAKEAYVLAERWNTSRSTEDISHLDFKESDLEDFDSNQIIVFLERLQSYPPLPLEHVKHLGKVYKLSTTSNAELRLRFYEVALSNHTSPSAEAFAAEAVKWVVGDDGTAIIKGRMKFCRPVFRLTGKIDMEMASRVFRENQEAFHPIARHLIEKDLGLVAARA